MQRRGAKYSRRPGLAGDLNRVKCCNVVNLSKYCNLKFTPTIFDLKKIS